MTSRLETLEEMRIKLNRDRDRLKEMKRLFSNVSEHMLCEKKNDSGYDEHEKTILLCSMQMKLIECETQIFQSIVDVHTLEVRHDEIVKRDIAKDIESFFLI